MGGLVGFTTNALAQWRNETNPEVNLDDYEGSLFASLFYFSVIVSPIGGFFSGWLGRKKAVIFTSPFVSVGWLIIGFAQNKIMLYIGRIVSSG